MKYFSLRNIIRTINLILSNFTFAKFLSAFITILLVASLKYTISSGFTIYIDLYNNMVLGLFIWLINTGLISILTDSLGIRGINFNLRQLLFGFETMKATTSSYETKDNVKKILDMINLAMESDEDLNRDESRRLDKGKEVNRGEEDKDNSRGIGPIYTDPEDIRRQKVLDDLNKDAIRRRSSFILEENDFEEDFFKLKTILSKMENMRDYNRINHKTLSISSNRYPEGVDRLSNDEIKLLVNTIINDPDVSAEVRQKVSNGTIPGRVAVNSVIIKYLESKTK